MNAAGVASFPSGPQRRQTSSPKKTALNNGKTVAATVAVVLLILLVKLRLVPAFYGLVSAIAEELYLLENFGIAGYRRSVVTQTRS